jgi:cob(I)alamin adenosyltransferase
MTLLEGNTHEATDISSMVTGTGDEIDTECAITEDVIQRPQVLAASACDNLRKAISTVGRYGSDLADKRVHLESLNQQLRECLAPDYKGDVDPYPIALDRKVCEKSIERLAAKVDDSQLKKTIKDTISVLKAYAETI